MHDFFKKIDIFSNISFDEEWHTYQLNGKKTISVTKVTGSVKEPFDAVKKSQECVARMKREAEEAGQPIPTITPEELQDQWARTNLIARAKGSAVHKYIEMTIANKLQRYPKDIVDAEFAKDLKKNPKMTFDTDPVLPLYKKITPMVDQVLADIRGKMYPVRSELVIGSPRYQVCGMIDQIFYNNKSQAFEIWDWKTNTKFDTTSKFHLEAPCEHLEACKLVEYSLQLHCYKRIFEEETGIEIKNCYLCWFSEAQPSYKVMKCVDVANEAKLLLEKAVEYVEGN